MADKSSSTTNLDLTQVPTDDIDQMASKINTFYDADSSVKTQLSWSWERNQMMLDGKQWLTYDTNSATGGQWKRLAVSKQSDYIPRPVTNYLFSDYQTIKSYLLKNRPRSKVFPNTRDYKDKNAAKLSDLVLEVNWERLHEDTQYEIAAANAVCYGTVFKKSYWDTSSLLMVKVPKMQQIPTTDPNTGAIMGMTEVQAVDPETKQPLFEELPLGELNTSVIEPYRIALDPLAMHLGEARWIMEYSVQPLDWVKETYGKEGPGYTGKAQDVQPETNLSGSLRRWFQLKNSSGVKEGTLGVNANQSSDIMIENACVVKEYYERPSAQHPKGRLIVVAGSLTVYSGDSPYDGNEVGDWHPYSDFRWEIVPGRFWGKSPLDDAIEPQKRINSIDSLIVLNRKTMAVPQKLIPNGSGIAPGTWTGRPGQEIYYRTDGQASPSVIPAMGLDASVSAERKQTREDMKEIVGSIDILKGDRPPGVNAASALSLLYEVGTGKLYPSLYRWAKFVEADQKKQLKIVAKMYREHRPEFIRALAAKNHTLSPMDINNFLGSSLYDNCNVVVEAGSNIPKLQAARQATLMELAQMGLLNLQNPVNRIQFQNEMGVQGYDGDIGPDKERAEWENDLLDNIIHSPDNKPVVLDADNDAIHVETHQNRTKSPDFMSLPFEVQQAYMTHIQEHEASANSKLQAQMLQQQATAPAPGAPVSAPKGAASQPANATAPQQPQHQGGGQTPGLGGGHGSGVPTSVKNSIMGADILTPATIGSRG